MTYPVNVTRSALSKTFFRTVHQGSISKEELIDYDPAKFLGPRQSVLGDISGLTMEITVPGRTDAEVGKLINFKYPRVSDASEKTDETLWDPFLSGVWMITAIHHKITPVAHKMIMEIAKDSFHTPFEFVERAPNPNLPEDNGSTDGSPSDPNESSSPVTLNKEGWTSPMAGGKVISPFGPRTHPVTGKPSNHTGVDLVKGGDLGRPILAAKGGKVIFAAAKGANGNLIKIDHGGGYVTAYAHGQDGSFKVKVGDEVKAGQHIMNCGSTGRSTGPHLHFEVQVNGKPVDPQPIFGWSRYGK
jgi:biotin carboxyl carrier protein